MKNLLSSAAIALMFLLVSCQERNDNPTNNIDNVKAKNISEIMDNAAFGQISFPMITVPDSLREAYEKYMFSDSDSIEANGEFRLTKAFEAYGKQEESIVVLDATVKKILSEFGANRFAFAIEQQAALEMLKILNEQTASQDVKRLIAFYTELLYRNKSREAKTIFIALNKLKGFWSEDKIATVAKSTALVSKQWIGSKKNRKGFFLQKEKEINEYSEALMKI